MVRGVILVLDPEGGALGVVAARLRSLGYLVLAAGSAESAARSVAELEADVHAALVPAEIRGSDVATLVRELRARLGSIECVVVGARPDDAARERLRAAGLELAAWEPWDDGTLRFQVNRALAGRAPGPARGAPRVPVALGASVEAGGRIKPAILRALSETGAYLETPRPSLPGVALVVEFPAARERVRVAGKVVYANVPGNLRRPNLPLGMAIRFTRVSEQAERSIRGAVADRSSALTV
ncbi:MAG TPA: PilZ domain-containing protein [Myxococcota bacterium]|nr:PilZ domain-containing protein [Myxococcota bacterium]